MRTMIRVLLLWAALFSPIAHAEEARLGDFTDPMFRSSLETSTCPNGVTEDSEQCDDNNGTVGDNCAANCRLFNCGDMNLDAPFENCDDGDNDSGDGCDGRFCFAESGWTCMGVGSASCVTICGDGTPVGTEQCDDGNVVNGDGCNVTCQTEPGFSCPGTPSVCTTTCGDGVPAGGETCDDGNLVNGDGCAASCAVEPGFACTGAPSACSVVCGDALIRGVEQCDDGNLGSGDGCNAMCAVEPGFSCSGEPSVCIVTVPNETEPNDDTVPNLSGGNGNDFANGFCENGTTACNVANAAQNCAGIGMGACTAHNTSASVLATGTFNASAGTQLIAAAISPAGDEDTYRVVNDTAGNILLAAESFGPGGVGTCAGVDTEINIRNAAGAELANDDDAGINNCSLEVFVLAPGDTRFVHVIEFNDDGVVPSYFVQLRFAPIICGDGLVGVNGVGEQCDDANLTNGDGCSSVCAVEPGFICAGVPSVCSATLAESEPNDDTIINPNGGNGNDFANGFCENATTSCNVANAAQNCAGIGGGTCIAHGVIASVVANGTYNASGGTQTITAALTPAGDEDTYRVVNDTVVPVTLTAETFGPGGVGTCVGVDTEINIRDVAGTELANDDESGINNCSLETFVLNPGDTRFVHVIDFDDNTAVASYFLQLRLQANAVAEVEPNNSLAEANVALPAIVASSVLGAAISPATDVDTFRIDIAATPTVVRFETMRPFGDCDATTTTLRLRDAMGTQFATDNSSGIRSCSAIVYPFQTAGTFYVSAEETGLNAAVAAYALEAKFLANVGAEGETVGTTGTNDTFATAEVLFGTPTDAFAFGDHTLAGDGISDRDYYAITVPAGASIRIETVEGDTNPLKTCDSGNLDSEITLFGTDGVTVLANNDDAGRGFCSMIDGTGTTPLNAPAHNLAAGTYFIEVRESDVPNAGTDVFVYRLAVTVRTP